MTKEINILLNEYKELMNNIQVNEYIVNNKKEFDSSVKEQLEKDYQRKSELETQTMEKILYFINSGGKITLTETIENEIQLNDIIPF